MTKPLLTWLSEDDCLDASLVGNKAARLAELRSLDYDVPNGFCLTTVGLERPTVEWHQALIGVSPQLAPPWVARSSANAEDSPNNAFPGLFTTVLDISDLHSAFEAITRVHSSVKSNIVITYAQHHGIDIANLRMAVLVQELVPATVAGVAFSRDPISGENNVVIEANYGIGETVVDGSVSPDSVTVGAEGVILARHLGSKRQKVIATTSGTRVRRVETSPLERSASVLSNEAALRVADLVRRIESDLGFPVDVEWAIDDDRLYTLQARPITVLPDRSLPEGTTT